MKAAAMGCKLDGFPDPVLLLSLFRTFVLGSSVFLPPKLFTGRVKVFYIRFHFTFPHTHIHIDIMYIYMFKQATVFWVCLSVECTSLDVTPKSHSIFMHITHPPRWSQHLDSTLFLTPLFFMCLKVQKYVALGKDCPTCVGNLIEMAQSHDGHLFPFPMPRTSLNTWEARLRFDNTICTFVDAINI